MDKLVDAKDLAQILGISRRRVYQLATSEKVLEVDVDGNYDVQRNVFLYYEKKFKSGNVDFDQEKAKHEKAKRELTEMKLKSLKNEMHPAKEIERVLTNMLVTFRNRILSVPQKVAPKLIAQKNITVVSEILRDELRIALQELSEYDPTMFTLESEDNEDQQEDNRPVSENSKSCSSSKENNS